VNSYITLYLKPDNKNTMVMVKVLNVNFNNISVISWRSASLVEETEVPRDYNKKNVDMKLKKLFF
jgi:hypothetical protein